MFDGIPNTPLKVNYNYIFVENLKHLLFKSRRCINCNRECFFSDIG